MLVRHDIYVADAAQGHEAAPGPQADQGGQECVAQLGVFKRIGPFRIRFNIEINISQLE